MKFERVIYGVILLFVGIVLLLSNFNVIDFYWRNVWGFWPVFLIIGGVNLLLNRNGSQTGSKISLFIMIVLLGFLFVKGQERPERNNRFFGWNNQKFDRNTDHDDEEGIKSRDLKLSEPYIAADSSKKRILNIFGGGSSFTLKEATDNLFDADVSERKANFSLIKLATDSTETLTFKMNGRKGKNENWSFNGVGSEVDVRLNKQPLWEMNIKMGVGEIDFDLTDYKVRSLNFDGGVADVKFKVGDLLPITDVTVKTGVTDVEINIPEASGCRIKSNTGLSARDFKGFTKTSDGVYETANYASSKNKVFINLDGGLSNFEVHRY